MLNFVKYYFLKRKIYIYHHYYLIIIQNIIIKTQKSKMIQNYKNLKSQKLTYNHTYIHACTEIIQKALKDM